MDSKPCACCKQEPRVSYSAYCIPCLTVKRRIAQAKHGKPLRLGARRRKVFPGEDLIAHTCTICKRLKMRAEFHTQPNGNAQAMCKMCWNKRQKRKYDNRPDDWLHPAVKASAKTKLHITPGEYRRVCQIFRFRQGNKCAICGMPFPSRPKPSEGAHLDHDHITGRLRGLLCKPCNYGIACFKDDPSAIRRARLYLLEWS